MTAAAMPFAANSTASPSQATSRLLTHVEVQKVVKVFRGGKNAADVHALGPVDFSIQRGEFFAVVGPSGCGKSTLLDIMAGLSRPSEGMVVFEGSQLRGTVPNGIGAVFQEDASFYWLDVSDNIAFGLRQNGTDPNELRRRVDYAIGFMGLGDFVRAYPAQLSGGMRQRMCIARTLVMQPRFILLDEPFGALDQQTRLLMGEELLRLWRETGSSILLITHSLDEATMLADRVGVMSARPGRFIDIFTTGWPRERTSEIVSNPEFGTMTARIWSLLRKESLVAMRGQQHTTDSDG
jgi:NitT/TauT family transport system ATP-binding protein